MKRLWRVQFSGECYVMAENEADACDEGMNACGIEAQDAGLVCDAMEVSRGERVPGNWQTAIPYGEQDDEEELTVQEIVNAMPVEPPPDPTLPMFPDEVRP